MNLPVDTTTAHADETEAMGCDFASELMPGSVVWLEGDLGAGKTVFARGCLAGLGVDGAVTSPTFTIARRYTGSKVEVSHLDLYRLGDGLSGEDPGMFDPEFGPQRITLIEWPVRGSGVLPDPDFHVTVDHSGGDMRQVRIIKCR